MRKANCKPKLNRELVIKCQVSKNNEEHLEVSIDHLFENGCYSYPLGRIDVGDSELAGYIASHTYDNLVRERLLNFVDRRLRDFLESDVALHAQESLREEIEQFSQEWKHLNKGELTIAS